MAHIFAQVSLGRTSLLPEDSVVNGFHFAFTGTITQTEIDSIAAQLAEFYTTDSFTSGGTGYAIQDFMSSAMALNAGRIKLYDMSQPVPRSPIHDVPFGITEKGGSALPGEVALVVSLRALLVSGTNPRSRRGRIYVGPLSASLTLGAVASGDVRPTGLLLSTVSAAAGRLRTYPTGPNWSIYSKTTAQLLPINECRVDDSFDTQRRRGSKPTLVVAS